MTSAYMQSTAYNIDTRDLGISIERPALMARHFYKCDTYSKDSSILLKDIYSPISKLLFNNVNSFNRPQCGFTLISHTNCGKDL